MFNPNPEHNVVPIGGAPYVPPYLTHFSLSPTSETSSPTSSSGPSSPVHSRFSSSSSSSSHSLEEWDAVQAHLNYARRMASHTANMWQKERLAIEKAKLEGTYTGYMTSRQNGNAKPPAQDASTAAASPATSSELEKKRSRRFPNLFLSGLTGLLSSTKDEEGARGRTRSRRHRA